MICVSLDGGLGNQLFQYAAGRALASRHSTDLLLDLSKLTRKKRGVTPRNYELNRFHHIGRIASSAEIGFLSWLDHFPFVPHWISSWHIYTEKGFGFNEAFVELPDNTKLNGYWQSFRYFQDIAPQLAGELAPVDSLSIASLHVLEKIRMVSSVAVHVRRGDYCSKPSAVKFHGALPLSYYEAAIAKIREYVDSPKIFVFSDDPDWCRQNLPLNNDAEIVVNNMGSDAWQDLILMSYCRHSVIANSSFSWWGAWLADQRYQLSMRTVIAPKCWFAGHSEQNISDRFPSHWIALS